MFSFAIVSNIPVKNTQIYYEHDKYILDIQQKILIVMKILHLKILFR